MIYRKLKKRYARLAFRNLGNFRNTQEGDVAASTFIAWAVIIASLRVGFPRTSEWDVDISVPRFLPINGP